MAFLGVGSCVLAPSTALTVQNHEDNGGAGVSPAAPSLPTFLIVGTIGAAYHLPQEL